MANKAAILDQITFGPWTVKSSKSHILPSEGTERKEFLSQLEIPDVPEMIFSQNILELRHETGCGIVFNALDALKLVDPLHDTIKVSNAQEWQASRSDSEHIHHVLKPFDWTFTTKYRGTFTGSSDQQLQVKKSNERIDLEKLKEREKIHFYADLMLFEDELHDHGCSILSIKIRVMPNCLFILMRFFMRVDDVLIRVYDTRIYMEAGKDYMIRECTCKESKISDLKEVEPHILTDPNEICEYLEVKEELIEKLELPCCVSSNSDASIPSESS